MIIARTLLALIVLAYVIAACLRLDAPVPMFSDQPILNIIVALAVGVLWVMYEVGRKKK